MKGLVVGLILIFGILPLGTISSPVALGMTIDTPKKQMDAGVAPEDVMCKVGLTLMIRATSDSAACVTPASAKKLVSAGWGTMVEGYEIMTEEMMMKDEQTMQMEYKPTTREFYIFTQVDEEIDEDALGIPPDQYSLTEMVVNQGDTVKVHFYNLEDPETEEHHTFTITDAPYSIHEDVGAGDNAVIEFVADTPGVFTYYCTFHQPTMRGELTVLPKGATPYNPDSADREIYLFTKVDEHIDEDTLSIPPDQYSMKQIIVNQGDHVKIHFYNLEPAESEEHHTFTIIDPAYNIHEDVPAESNSVIEFDATTPGVFKYYCTFHPPTMSGELIVMPKSTDGKPVMLAPSTRDLYLFTEVDEHIDEEALGIYPDQYSMKEIVVNKGDTVRVHFYNLEPPETEEHHTFTIYSPPAYNINADVPAGEDTVVEFVADTPGVFKYFCSFHQPTMSGELIVLG